MYLKQHSIPHRMSVYCKNFALGFALICVQLTLGNASAQTNESAAQALQQAEALFEQGYNAHSKGDVKQAIRDYTQAIALNPSYAEAYNNRGAIYRELNNY